MREPRHQSLPQDGGMVHKFWRAHNREFLLEQNKVKDLYLRYTFEAIAHRSVESKVQVHAFCVMSNHCHQLTSYQGSSKVLSSYMRIAHSRFGQTFNRLMNRQGAVAYDRPKTPLVQPDAWHQMKVHFYIEANPLRANMVKNLKLFQFSSFRFYAWGIKDEHSKNLVAPEWYTNLGSTPKQRQAKYRSLFDAYTKEMRQRYEPYTLGHFIGDAGWVYLQKQALKQASAMKSSNDQDIPLKPPD